jgi:seryl-tRNA synthetase
MLDIKFIEENKELVFEKCIKRSFDTKYIDDLLTLNKNRKECTQSYESKKSEVNKLSKEIGIIKSSGGDANDIITKVSTLKDAVVSLDAQLKKIQNQQYELLLQIPNLLDEDVPLGESEEQNKFLFEKGTIKNFDFKPRDHVELGEKLGQLDFEAGSSLTGSRFVVYKSSLAKLERALINYMLDKHSKNGYVEVIPPFIVNDKALIGTGQLPKFKDDLFKLEGNDWYLIPTAEVPLTNLKRDQTFKDTELPLKYTAYTPCFRSEAGSYGKDTRGLIRLHQFNKVELVNIVHPEESKQAHEKMIESATSILNDLKLPFRAMLLCSGDVGFGSMKTIDLEVWLPGQGKYREISSISNCGEFQSRRANMRFKSKTSKKPIYPHTLNGSGLAVGRTLVAILENYQNEDGSIDIPEVLLNYMGGLEKIKI